MLQCLTTVMNATDVQITKCMRHKQVPEIRQLMKQNLNVCKNILRIPLCFGNLSQLEIDQIINAHD